MRETPKDSLFSRAHAALNGHRAEAYTAAAMFFLMSLVSFAPALLSPIALLLTVPFLFFPSLFVFLATVGGLVSEKGFSLTNSHPWAIFRNYFANRYLGVFRPWSALWKAALAYLACSLLLSALSGVLENPFFPGLSEELNSFYALYADATIDATALYAYLQSAEAILSFMTFSWVVSFGVAATVYFHFVTLSAMNIYIRSAMSRAPMRAVTSLYVGAIRAHPQEFYGPFYSAFWPLALLFLAGYMGTAYGLSFATSESSFLLAGGLAGGMLLASLYLPLFGAGLCRLFEDMQPSFASYSKEAARRAYERMKAQMADNQEALDELERQFHQLEEETGENLHEDPSSPESPAPSEEKKEGDGPSQDEHKSEGE